MDMARWVEVVLFDRVTLSYIFVIAVLLFTYFKVPLFLSLSFLVALLWRMGLPEAVVMVIGGVALIFILPPLRRALISCFVMKWLKRILPKISETEKVALEAGVVWVESSLFSGKPDFKKLMSQPYPKLSQEEQDFIDGPLREICSLVDSWEIWKLRALPDSLLKKIKDHKFFGMVIPKEYGGLGFSAYAHSRVIEELSIADLSLGVMVMVPNSLGPAELLVHFGTQAQKDKYLPSLATGEDIPCFGLTEPQAGSDAGAISSEGVLFKGEDGQIYLRLNWKKRWITLSMISTLIGLAFRLKDPDNLLGRGEDLGITCGLIPSNKEGVVINRRHDPLGVPFYNCPMEGHDVIVNAEESIIGGVANAGKGWAMLMECLGAGRGISLPSQAAGGVKHALRVSSNHAGIRKQFGVPLAKLEGVEEPLARLVGQNYFQEATRLYTLSALDQGIKPPVVTAIAKYFSTEMARKAVNDAMDILGGQGISMGPDNPIAIRYIASPISITVEGANILTRTLIIFGQGSLRAHPYAFKEIKAIENKDLKTFDRAFWGHMGHILNNFSRAVFLSVSRAHLSGRGYGGYAGRYFQKLSWTSANYAFMTDLAMGTLGGRLKFKEKLTGRYADILIWMYVITATLRRFKEDGCPVEDRPLLDYSMKLGFSEIQKAFDGIFANLDIPLLSWFFKGPMRWLHSLNTIGYPPSDDLTHKLAQWSQTPGESRDRISKLSHVTEGSFLDRQEKAFAIIKESEPIERKMKLAIRKKQLTKVKRLTDVLDEAIEKNIISPNEAEKIRESAALRWDLTQVNDFSQEEYLGRG